jgi:hypothetical protein
MAKSSSTWDRSLADFRPLIAAQGEVGYAYNHLQDSFCSAFVFAMGIERPRDFILQKEFISYATAIWHVIPNDRTQRQLALTALANIPTTLDIKGGIERLEWARIQTDKLADYRNLIVHAPMRYWPNLSAREPYKRFKIKMVPRIGGLSTKPTHINRLDQIKSVRFWKALRNDFLNLNDYVSFVNRQMRIREYDRHNRKPVFGAHRAWPHKPKLPCLRRIKTIDQAVKAASSPPGPPKRRKRQRPLRGKPQAQS